MIPAGKTTAPLFHRIPQARAIFRIEQQASGRWCVNSADGMTGGTFFERDAAIRFARRESVGGTVLVLIERAQRSGIAAAPFRAAITGP
jgi:hypothetical protein